MKIKAVHIIIAVVAIIILFIVFPQKEITKDPSIKTIEDPEIIEKEYQSLSNVKSSDVHKENEHFIKASEFPLETFQEFPPRISRWNGYEVIKSKLRPLDKELIAYRSDNTVVIIAKNFEMVDVINADKIKNELGSNVEALIGYNWAGEKLILKYQKSRFESTYISYNPSKKQLNKIGNYEIKGTIYGSPNQEYFAFIECTAWTGFVEPLCRSRTIVVSDTNSLKKAIINAPASNNPTAIRTQSTRGYSYAMGWNEDLLVIRTYHITDIKHDGTITITHERLGNATVTKYDYEFENKKVYVINASELKWS